MGYHNYGECNRLHPVGHHNYVGCSMLHTKIHINRTCYIQWVFEITVDVIGYVHKYMWM